MRGLLLVLLAQGPVPGTVIDRLPAKGGQYVGSPSLAILPDGSYVASHDRFGPKIPKVMPTDLFRSKDRGATWTRLPSVMGSVWAGLFVHRDALYLMGLDGYYGALVIRRSTDGGANWSPPSTLRDGANHTAPVPVVVARGRIWRAFEARPGTKGWAPTFRAGVISAPEGADLLDPASWTTSSLLPSDRRWNGGDMGGWLEGNAVVSPNGSVVDLLRVDVRRLPERAAIVRLSTDGRTATFDPASGFVDFPGGAKKFTVRYDPVSRLYWSLASVVPAGEAGVRPSRVRNVLALVSSPDLARWTVGRTIASGSDVRREGFQYADWQFDGDDLVAVVRTAFGGAPSAHNANLLTFHRVRNFRDEP